MEYTAALSIVITVKASVFTFLGKAATSVIEPYDIAKSLTRLTFVRTIIIINLVVIKSILNDSWSVNLI